MFLKDNSKNLHRFGFSRLLKQNRDKNKTLKRMISKFVHISIKDSFYKM